MKIKVILILSLLSLIISFPKIGEYTITSAFKKCLSSSNIIPSFLLNYIFRNPTIKIPKDYIITRLPVFSQKQMNTINNLFKFCVDTTYKTNQIRIKENIEYPNSSTEKKKRAIDRMLN